MTSLPFRFIAFTAYVLAASRVALWALASEYGESAGLYPLTGISYDLVALGIFACVRIALDPIPLRWLKAAATALTGAFVIALPVANQLHLRFFRAAIEPSALGRAGALGEIAGLVAGAMSWRFVVFLLAIPLAALAWSVACDSRNHAFRPVPFIGGLVGFGLLMGAGCVVGNQCWQRERMAARFPHPMHENVFIRWGFNFPSTSRMRREAALSLSSAVQGPDQLRRLFPLDGDPGSRFVQQGEELARQDSAPLLRIRGIEGRRERLSKFGIDADKLDQGPLNVVLVVMESMRAAELKAFGNRAPYLPTLDRLASEGLLATRAYSTSLQSSEATFAANTGFYPLSTGRPFFGFWPGSLRVQTLPAILAAKGYDTGWYIGCKASFEGEGDFMRTHGVGRITDESAFPKDAERFTWKGHAVSDGEIFSKAGKDFLEVPSPFYMAVTTMTSHGPFTLPDSISDSLDSSASRFSKDGKTVEFHGDYLKYRRAQAYMDRELGRFIQTASARPDFDRTIFLIYGDHGTQDGMPKGEDAEALGLDIQGPHHRELPYRIPVILWSPGGLIPPGRISRPVAQIDFLPTILDLLGFEAEGSFLGHSMFDVPEGRTILLGMGGAHGIRDGVRCWATEKECFIVDDGFDADLFGTFSASPAPKDVSDDVRSWAESAAAGTALLGRQNRLAAAPKKD